MTGSCNPYVHFPRGNEGDLRPTGAVSGEHHQWVKLGDSGSRGQGKEGSLPMARFAAMPPPGSGTGRGLGKDAVPQGCSVHTAFEGGPLRPPLEPCLVVREKKGQKK